MPGQVRRCNLLPLVRLFLDRVMGADAEATRPQVQRKGESADPGVSATEPRASRGGSVF